MNKKKIISVIIPYYKKKSYFKETINSVISQKFKNFEVIVIYDDKDKTDLSFVKSVIKNKKNIKLILNRKNLGAGISRNRGIKVAKGKYITFIDSDDLWSKEKLSIQYDFMKKNNIKISHTSYDIINSKNEIIGNRTAKKIQNYKDLISSCDIGLSSVMLDKKILAKNKFSNLITKEDYSLWLNLSKKHNIYGLKRNLVKWRKTDSSLSSNTIQKLRDAYFIYFNQEKQGILRSLVSVFILSINFLIKNRTTKKI